MNKEDVQRITQFEIILEGAKAGYGMPMTGYYDLEWLVNRIKNLADENGKLMEELQKANKDLADFREYYEG